MTADLGMKVARTKRKLRAEGSKGPELFEKFPQEIEAILDEQERANALWAKRPRPPRRGGGRSDPAAE